MPRYNDFDLDLQLDQTQTKLVAQPISDYSNCIRCYSRLTLCYDCPDYTSPI